MRFTDHRRLVWALLPFVVLIIFTIVGSVAWGQDTKATVKLHIPGYSPNSIPFQIAEARGFYKEEGLDVQTTRMKTGAGVQALIAGSVDVSQILGLTLRAAISRGAPLKIVMVFNDRPLYQLLAKKEIKSFADLKGKIVASTTPGASNDVLLRRGLEQRGLDLKRDLTIVYIGESITLWQALSNGSVHAAVLNPPYNVLAKEAGFRELAEFASEVGALQGGVSVSGRFLKERPEVAGRFIRATWRGLKFFRTDREGSIPIMGKFMDVHKETAAKIYDGSIGSFVDSGFISEDFQRKVLEFEFDRVDDSMLQKAFDFSVVKSLKGS